MTQRKKIPDSNMALFFSYFMPHKKLFIADIICALFVSFVDLYFPVLSRHTINDIVPQYNDNPNKTMKTFIIIVAVCLLMFILRTVANMFINYFGHMFGVKVETDMRKDVFRHIEQQSFSYFDSHRTGKIMTRVTNDLFEVSELAHHCPEDALISALTLIGSFIIMFKVKWQLAVIIFTILPIMIFVILTSRKSLLNTSKKIKETTGIINSDLESAISGVRVTKVFTNENYEFERFDKSNKLYFDAKSLYYKAMAKFSSKSTFITSFLNVVVLAVGGYYIMKGEMTLGDYIAANLFVAAFLPPIRRLQNLLEQFSTGMAGFLRFAEIIRNNEYTEECENALELKEAKGDIQYSHVSFSYNEASEVLKDLNLNVKAGQTLALVGPSGSGKSTICNLLPRFYDSTEGKITIDGHDIKTLTLDSLRKKIGVVQQDVFLFAGTIKENISYGKIGATDAEIEEAARRAEIYDDIMAMPDGFDTIVGERGIKLSGGQKQRVSIARIFLKNPPILILDEATSALDSATEIKIQKSFDELAKGRTTFIIAHRLSTIKNANAIAVVSNEGISEYGTHEELMAKGGIYKKLYTAQFGQI